MHRNVALTLPEFCEFYRIGHDKALGWIRNGKLRAINVSNGRRPRYVITPDAVAEWEHSRSNAPPSPPRVIRRKPRIVGRDPESGLPVDENGIIQYF